MMSSSSSDSAREFDVVVFGASGFTGAYVAKELRKHRLRVALAGRSESKLAAVRSSEPLILADVNDAASLLAMARRARVVLNCVGPYRFFGEPVVKACIEGGAHYLDISGEPEFLERIAYNYHQMAKDAGVVVVGACGFDSIPSDMGTVFTVQQFPVAASYIDSYLSVSSNGHGMCIHYATYESAVHGFGSAANLAKLRKLKGKVTVPYVGPRQRRYGPMHFAQVMNAYTFPFMGSDASIVRRSQEQLALETPEGDMPVKPVQYAAYVTIPSFFWAVMLSIFGGIFGIMAQFGLGRRILLRFPRLFSFGLVSHEGPSEVQLRNTTFKMTFVAKGYSQGPPSGDPDTEIITEVSGPEPGYVATPIAMVQSALTVLEERPMIPSGVQTTASAFRGTSLISRLQNAGLSFSVLSRKSPFKDVARS